jgi:hypothetical protein
MNSPASVRGEDSQPLRQSENLANPPQEGVRVAYKTALAGIVALYEKVNHTELAILHALG